MGKPIQECLKLVADTQREMNKLLSGPEHVGNLLPLNGFFDRIRTRLVFMGGVIEHDEKTTTKHEFGPITNFMGDKIVRPEKVTAADLNPTEAAKQKYIARVESLYKELPLLSPSALLNAYSIPEDILVLRGVAKRAGVKGYEDRELTVDFIEDIILSIEMKNEEKKKQDLIDDQLKKQGKPVERQVTQEEIKKNLPAIIELGLKAGDTVLEYPDGRIDIKPKIAVSQTGE